MLEKECTFESIHVIQMLVLKTLDCVCTCVYTQWVVIDFVNQCSGIYNITDSVTGTGMDIWKKNKAPLPQREIERLIIISKINIWNISLQVMLVNATLKGVSFTEDLECHGFQHIHRTVTHSSSSLLCKISI